jgi:hypothetical protein
LIEAADFNRRQVRDEVAAQFELYETALRANDVASLDAFFLARDDTVRYGLAEQHYGSGAIALWRAGAPPVHPGRELLKLLIVCYGADCASVNAEFREPQRSGTLRQSQVWVRTAQGWRIGAAHVSLNAPD